MTIDLAGRTHVGLKRSENQDEVFAKVLSNGDHSFACLAVADGMGGHERGREASQKAIGTLRDTLESWAKKGDSSPTEQWCAELEEAAHKSVRVLSTENEVCGTTLTVALLTDAECVIGHVGDSRAYSFRDGKLEQLTEDQTWEAYSLKNGLDNTQGKALRQAIGVGDRILPETYRLDLMPTDCLLLCSDGLHKMVDLAEVEAELASSTSADDACDRLVRLALDGGGKDNIAICVARLGVMPPEAKKIDAVLVIAATLIVIVSLLLLLAVMGKI